jgi:hypothetical protein
MVKFADRSLLESKTDMFEMMICNNHTELGQPMGDRIYIIDGNSKMTKDGQCP